MQRAKLFIGAALLLAGLWGIGAFYGELPHAGKRNGHYAPKALWKATFSRDSILERQVPVQVLKSDFGKRLRFDELRLLPDTLFETRDPCCNFIGNDRDTTWLRFAVINKTDTFTKFYVELINPFIKEITFYALHTQRDTTYRAGTDFPFAARPEPGFRNFLYRVGIAEGDTAWFYFRIRSETPLHLRILVFEEMERQHYQQWIVDTLMTIFYVFSALFLILIAILIVASKGYFHWYYFGYVLLTALFIPAHLGLGFMYVWKQNGDFQHIVPMALNNLRLVFGIQFFRLYFDLPRIAPRYNRFIDFSIGIFLFILFLHILQGIFGQKFTEEVFSLFFGFLALFSLAMLLWLLRQLFLKGRRRLSWLLLVVALNFIGVGITSLQHLGWGSSGFDISNRLLALFGIANTFFLSPFVIGAFFLEQVLVFHFAVRRYLRLIEKNQKNQLRLARTKEEGLNALILGIENERKRIARDLHDGACVNLAAINMKVDALREEVSGNAALTQKIADIAGDLELTYREVRGISHDLMSKALDTTGLQTALEDLAVRIRQAQPGLSVHFFSNYPLNTVNNLAKIHLYRIAQELLANVLKHAQATVVNLQLLEDQGSLLLTVEDDGRGFDIAEAGAGGIGLSNVRTRAEVLRGKMHLDTSPGKGTFVSIEVPADTLAE